MISTREIALGLFCLPELHLHALHFTLQPYIFLVDYLKFVPQFLEGLDDLLIAVDIEVNPTAIGMLGRYGIILLSFSSEFIEVKQSASVLTHLLI